MGEDNPDKGREGLTLGALILVQHHHADWSSQSDAELSAGLNQYSVFLIARGSDVALAWPAAGHLRLNIVLGELHSWRATIDDAAD